MPEDKLTHRQRVRLEALSQAIQSFMCVPPEGLHERMTLEDLMHRAEQLESWLLKAGLDIH
jgi:hypothetical protein